MKAARTYATPIWHNFITFSEPCDALHFSLLGLTLIVFHPATIPLNVPLLWADSTGNAICGLARAAEQCSEKYLAEI